VEQALLGLEGIVSAVVSARKGLDGQAYLAGYYVSREELAASRLRQQLAKRLPEYMVPGYLVQLDRLPLTSNGKVDRKALPDPQSMESAGGGEYVGPRNDTENILDEILRRIVSRKRISMEDNFFDIGGNSMHLLKLKMEIKNRFDVVLEIKELFNLLTIAELAEMIDSVKWLQKGKPDAHEMEITI
jgi:acyl carrier protein